MTDQRITAGTRALLDRARADCHRAFFAFLARELSPGRPAPVTASLRRRREAALRLPPLPDGRHDPMDPETR